MSKIRLGVRRAESPPLAERESQAPLPKSTLLPETHPPPNKSKQSLNPMNHSSDTPPPHHPPPRGACPPMADHSRLFNPSFPPLLTRHSHGGGNPSLRNTHSPPHHSSLPSVMPAPRNPPPTPMSSPCPARARGEFPTKPVHLLDTPEQRRYHTLRSRTLIHNSRRKPKTQGSPPDPDRGVIPQTSGMSPPHHGSRAPSLTPRRWYRRPDSHLCPVPFHNITFCPFSPHLGSALDRRLYRQPRPCARPWAP